eukprot:Filipodium_phascolosomae@DN3175_c0_g1_i1.p1
MVEQWLTTVNQHMLACVVDKNKGVQEAACSAFASLEEAAGPALAPHLDGIITAFLTAASIYQAKNRLILFDAIGTLAEAVGAHLSQQHLQRLLPPVLEAWDRCSSPTSSPNEREVIAVYECMTSFARALKEGFLELALRLVPSATLEAKRILTEISQFAAQEASAQSSGTAIPQMETRPDREKLAVSLDLLAGVT